MSALSPEQLLILLAMLLLAGCGKDDPLRHCNHGFISVHIIEAKAKRECSDAGKCWLSADDYAEIKKAESYWPECFGRVE